MPGIQRWRTGMLPGEGKDDEGMQKKKMVLDWMAKYLSAFSLKDQSVAPLSAV
ncbi:MAG TPA: hypothetical protein VFU49_19335 [Ktedonobacteraceae bacterium]|nr:hypothetical protein [Ktedonobacteraceae bacterium]